MCEKATMAARKPKVPPGPPEKIFQAGIVRDDAKYLYYIDKQCNAVRMERGVAKARTEVIVVTDLQREKGWGYYVDLDGDVTRQPET